MADVKSEIDMTGYAKVCSVSPNLIQIEIIDTEKFRKYCEDKVSIGSYITVADDSSSIIAIIKAYKIKDQDMGTHQTTPEPPHFVLDAEPVGYLKGGKFVRGVQKITIPPKRILLTGVETLTKVYSGKDDCTSFSIGNLVQHDEVRVPIDGDAFFGKHIAVVGSTGSGKSCAVAKIIQEGIKPSGDQDGKGVLNNSHIVIFDLHGEYSAAFPEARVLNMTNLKLPYWLMNAEELEEMFILSDERNSHNQISQFRYAVLENKKKHNPSIKKLSYDTPVFFDIEQVYNYIFNLNLEIVVKSPEGGVPKLKDETEVPDRRTRYFDEKLEFVPPVRGKASSGPFAGDFDRFVLRLRNVLDNERLRFLFKPEKEKGVSYQTNDMQVLFEMLIGYGATNNNITIVELDGIPFEVQSLVVSLISRIIFDLGYYWKKSHNKTEIPFLAVYEEAHKYAPNSQLARYNSVRKSIERIAKEGRKYGVSLMIVSQRPSEISETIFSQCNSFVAMRLTNPADQNYVRRLLPDSISSISDGLPNLEQREALILGEAVQLPSLIKVDKIDNVPDSHDVKVLKEWQEDWRTFVFKDIIEGMKQL